MLGGHMSKVHNQMSVKYKNMLIKRDDRAVERELRQKIKSQYLEHCSSGKGSGRDRITTLKRRIKKQI